MIIPECNSLFGVMRWIRSSAPHAAIWALVSKGGAPSTVAQGHCCPNVRTEVPDPSASREDLSSLPRWNGSGPRRLHHLPMGGNGVGLELEVSAVSPQTEHDDGELARDSDAGLVKADLLRQPQAPVFE